MNINWNELWIKIFGTDLWLNIDIGFWISMAVTAIIVVLMNVVFWNMKPLKPQEQRAGKRDL